MKFTATGSINHDPDWMAIEVIEIDGPGHYSVLVHHPKEGLPTKVEVVPSPPREDLKEIAEVGMAELGIQIKFDQRAQ